MNGFQIVWYFIKTHFMTDLQKDFEILALRSQLSVLQQHIINHKITKPRANNCFRMLWVLLSKFFLNWKSVLILFKPETVIGWHKCAFKFYWKLKSKGGRPKISHATIALIKRIHKENPTLSPEKIYEQLILLNIIDAPAPNIKIVEFQVLNSQGAMVQPKTFFGDAVIGFKIPEGFNVDDISLIRVVANGEDITLRSKIWVDPDDSDLKYIEGTTNHFSPYAILSPWNESILATGDNTWILVTGISAVLLVSAGVFVWMNRKKKFKKV